jgi:hypothetical protein
MINRYTRINKEEYDEKRKNAYRILERKKKQMRKVEEIRENTVKEYRKFCNYVRI